MNLFEKKEKRIIDLDIYAMTEMAIKTKHKVLHESKNFMVNDIGDGYLYVSNYEWQTMKVSDWIEDINDEFVSNGLTKKEWVGQIIEIANIMDKFNKDNKLVV